MDKKTKKVKRPKFTVDCKKDAAKLVIHQGSTLAEAAARGID